MHTKNHPVHSPGICVYNFLFFQYLDLTKSDPSNIYMEVIQVKAYGILVPVRTSFGLPGHGSNYCCVMSTMSINKYLNICFARNTQKCTFCMPK